MSVGTILVSLAVLSVVVAYVARPFRRVAVDPDVIVEAWVRRARATVPAEGVDNVEAGDILAAPSSVQSTVSEPVGAVSPEDDEGTNFCPHCGRRVEPDHLFCPRCGKPLGREAAQ